MRIEWEFEMKECCGGVFVAKVRRPCFELLMRFGKHERLQGAFRKVEMK